MKTVRLNLQSHSPRKFSHFKFPALLGIAGSNLYFIWKCNEVGGGKLGGNYMSSDRTRKIYAEDEIKLRLPM